MIDLNRYEKERAEINPKHNNYKNVYKIKYRNGEYAIQFMANEEYHRLCGPAVLEYNVDQELIREIWIQKGKIHRLLGPALTDYHADTKMAKRIAFYRDDQLHNLEGPAIIEYDRFGNVTKMSHYFNGECADDEFEGFEVGTPEYELHLHMIRDQI